MLLKKTREKEQQEKRIFFMLFSCDVFVMNGKIRKVRIHLKEFLSRRKNKYRAAQKTLYRKKLTILITARTNELISFVNDRGIFKL
jgi:hypothetical protein